jgi:probable DNA repair protein
MNAAAQGTTVLTGNTRSARALRLAAEDRLRTATRAWLTPDVLPYAAFVARLYADALVAGDAVKHVLHREQELQLWRQIIEHSPSGRAMLLPESAAALAADAFRTAIEYNIALNSPLMSASSDTRAFSGWAAEFERQLAAHGWTCTALLPRELAVSLVGRGLPEKLFVFLPELTPAQRELLSALAEAGVEVNCAYESSETEPDASEFNATRREFPGVAEELRAAAQWARQQVEVTPGGRVGVIFFDLAHKLPQVESAFRSVLHPEHLLGLRAPAAYEIASPLALAEYPAVRCALQLLQLRAGSLDFHSFAAMLTSPYFAEVPEANAAFVAHVRKHAQREVSFDELMRWLHESPLLPRLRAAVERLPKHSAFASEQSAAYWADISRRILEALGWPGKVALNSEEFQSTERWRELLVAISSLELLEWRTDFAGFFERLERMAAAQNFKPETLNAPVQIMDADEAEGSVFDALWIGSCSDDLWPDSPKPSPLLPVALLREAGFSLVGTEQADSRIMRITHRLLHSAPEVTLSVALRTDDEREQRWSPAFAQLPLASNTLDLPQPLALCFAPAALEAVSDSAAPALRSDENARGGTSLLQEQSNCPFQAFAVRRLLAKQADGPNEAMAPNERGKLVERALQLIWEELEGSDGLQRADRAAIIERAVDLAMSEELPARTDAWTVRFRQLERVRTIEVLNEWLAVEAQRAPFHVLGHQMEVELTLGGLQLRGRLDRLDEIGDAPVVIDYKTGAVNGVKVWQVPRPRMPQLPFYAVAMQSRKFNLAGVAFGVVRRGEAAFRGYLRDPNLLPCSAPRRDYFDGLGFAEYTERWATELESIAASFVAGAASVDPKTPPGMSNSTCEHCHLASLCRIGDLAAPDVDDDGGDDE